MGNSHSRPEDRLRAITRELNSLRSSLKTSQQNISRSKKEFIVESLAHYSSEVSSMHGKVKRKDMEETLKNLSDTMQEILKIEPSELDAGAVESDSFVNVPINQRRSNSLGSLRSTRKSTKDQTPVNRSSVPTLRDIEAKVDELRTQISTAIDNKDSKQLRVYRETIRVLATDLELIHAEKDTPLEKRKKSIDEKIVTLYQKVSKALNALKKDDNLINQSKQHKKNEAMSELTKIEVQLAENETLLDKLIKEKKSSGFATIRNNIVANNQRLNKVDIVDNEVKEKVVLLSQKLTETVKTLDRVMAKREFDSKFSKSLENYERIVRNFDGSTNADDTVKNLQNLRNSIQNLEEINDTTKNRKRDLLNDLNNQIDNFNELLAKQADKKIIEKIVEDNVILRNKAKSSDTEHTVIDQFVAHWHNVKLNFDVNAYSNISLLRIDKVLQEMQQSINEIRIEIANKCDTNPPSNLARKHSQSVPRLNARKTYSSNRSLDQLDSGKIIKTKAKMYNISTPELQNVEKQQQHYANYRFSKIEEIKLQVHYIKEKIDDSHNKNLLREKLEQYRRNLGEYVQDSNKTVANNAALVSNEIIELLHKLVLAEFRERVDVISKRVHNFHGTRYDKEFDEVKDDLIKVQLNLENFNVPNEFDLLVTEKGELLDEVGNSIESLQEKSCDYRKYEDENVKQLKTRLQALSDRVKRFSGTYKGVLYNSIERDLNKLLLDAGEHVEDKVWSTEITKETERLLNILEQRASIAQSFRTSKPEESKTEQQAGMSKIKRDLFNIKKEIDRTPENNVDAFIGLQSRLDLVNLELSQIAARSNENLAKEKEIFSNEAQTLKNVVDAKVALGQQPMVQWPERELQPDLNKYPKNDVNKEIEQFENAFAAIKQEITAPNTEHDVHKFYKLAQDIKNLTDKLNKYKFIRGTDLHTRQSNMLNDMRHYVDALEKGAIDVDYVLNIERKLDKLENLFESNHQHDLKIMAKELQGIQHKLQEHNFNTTDETLRNRKTSVQNKTEDLAQKLKEMEVNEQGLLRDTKKIDEIEEKVRALGPQIASFIGLKAENKYYELNETVIRTILMLDKIDTENEDLQKRRIRLLKELHALGQTLDDRAKQTEDIVNTEQGLHEVSSMIENFSGEEKELSAIKSKMESIKRKLNGLRVINDLITRKNACIERFSVLFNKCMTLVALSVQPENTVSPPSDHDSNSSSSRVSSQIRNGQNFQTDHISDYSSHQVSNIQKTTDYSSGYLSKPESSIQNSQTDNSLGQSSQTQSSYATVTQQRVSSGYTSQIYNFMSNNILKTSQSASSINEPILDRMEKELERIETAVAATTDADQLQKFDDVLTKYTIDMGQINYPKDSAQHLKKCHLYQRIENITNIIEDKMAENDRLTLISAEVDNISSKMNTPLSYDQINKLDERLIQMQVTLGKMNNPVLKNQIDSCMMRIILCLQRFSEFKASIQTTSV